MMKVRHIVKLHCFQLRVKAVQSPKAFMLACQICSYKTYILRQFLKKRLPHGTAQYSYLMLGILYCQRMYYGHCHCDITKS